MISENKITTIMDEYIILTNFKAFYDNNNNTISKQRLRNILSRAKDKSNAIKSIFHNEMKIELTSYQSIKMLDLIIAFLNKSNFREPISNETKKSLLIKQNYKCVFCGKKIDLSAHADHKIPFKYVGDELNNNLQMLCEHCNESKSSSIDYETRVLLNLYQGGKR